MKRSILDYADAATAALKVLCNPDPNERTYPVIVGTHPQNIAELPLNVSRSLTKQWKGKSKLFYLLDNGMLACGHGNSNSKGNKKGVSNIVRNYVFSKVVVVLRDSVTSIWTKYQQDNGIKCLLTFFCCIVGCVAGNIVIIQYLK